MDASACAVSPKTRSNISRVPCGSVPSTSWVQCEGLYGSCPLFLGAYGDAAVWAEKAVQENPNYLIVNCIAAASHAFAGDKEKAAHFVRRMLQIDPPRAFPGSRHCSRFVGRMILRNTKKVYARPDCPSDGHGWLWSAQLWLH